MTYFVLIATLNCLASDDPTSPKRSKTADDNRYAILVGVDKYDSRDITELSGPTNDTYLLRQALIKYAKFPENNITVLSSSGPRATWPDKNVILQAISRIKTTAPPNSLLLFMFSGHGVVSTDRKGISRAFLLPKNAVWTTDFDLLEDTSLPVEMVRERIASTNIRQVIILLDSCRNSPQSSKSAENNTFSKAYKKDFDFHAHNDGIEASLLFYAASDGQRAYVDHSKHDIGYFTEAVAEALEGAAADQDGNVTLGNLVETVQAQVPTMAMKGGYKQEPDAHLSGFRAFQLVISHASPKGMRNNLELDLERSMEDRPAKPLTNLDSDEDYGSSDEILLEADGAIKQCDHFLEHTEMRLRSDEAIMDDINVISHEPPDSNLRKRRQAFLESEKSRFYARQMEWWNLIYRDNFAKAYFTLMEAVPNSDSIPPGTIDNTALIKSPAQYWQVQGLCSSLGILRNRYKRVLEMQHQPNYYKPSENEKRLMAPPRN
ncbi:caspase family protein [Edaphobacter sp. HDX4]|uniref:caspase family protein n=1 Tax=Edaphobacter sp. HDX4 TaxID=2794064 RepID=UPI002FE5E4B9